MDLHLIILCFVAFCIDNYTYYKVITNVYKLPDKNKEGILSAKNALLMVILSITHSFLGSKEQIAILGTLYFLSYLFVDIYIGNAEYHESMLGVTGNFHHLSYIFIGFVILLSNMQSVFMLFMISELPTLIMTIGRYKQYRNDTYFGVAFFLTRILAHSALVYSYSDNIFVTIFGGSSLVLHLYWFKNWASKYLKL
jgi:hypothetical protein